MAAETFTSDGTHIARAATATVQLWGPGGTGGHAGDPGIGPGGGGGGGGAYITKAVSGLEIGHYYEVKVGIGANSTFDTDVAIAAAGSDGDGATGGTGGLTASSVGDTKRAGGNGGAGHLTGGGGGGGGSAGTANVGLNGANGGVSLGGAGGVAVTNGGAGGAGGNGDITHPSQDAEGGAEPGGGGGGTASYPDFPETEGATGTGANGKCVVTYTEYALDTSVSVDSDIGPENTSTFAELLVDEDEELTGNAGVVDLTTVPDGAKYFIGFDLTMSVATGPITVVFKDSSDVEFFTQVFSTNGHVFFRGLRQKVAVGETIQLTGGGPNAIFSGVCFWE